MGRLLTYLAVSTGLILLFYFMGLVENTANSTLLNLLLSPENLEDSSLSVVVFTALTGVTAAAVISIGILTGNTQLAIMGPVAVYLFNILWDFIEVFNVLREANPIITILLFAPLMLLWGVTVIDWWRGVTS